MDNATPRTGLRAVLFDRDGTLVVDVPYNGDPSRVELMPGAAQAVRMLRERGVRVGVVSNQSGIARGLLTREQVDAVNAEVDRQAGPFDVWTVCPHGPDDGCRCRKPAPGMVLSSARALGVEPNEVAVIGDIGADIGAAQAAGAHSVLVPTPITLQEEIDSAPVVAPDILAAVELLLDDRGLSSADRLAAVAPATARTAPTEPARSGSERIETAVASSGFRYGAASLASSVGAGRMIAGAIIPERTRATQPAPTAGAAL